MRFGCDGEDSFVLVWFVHGELGRGMWNHKDTKTQSLGSAGKGGRVKGLCPHAVILGKGALFPGGIWGVWRGLGALRARQLCIDLFSSCVCRVAINPFV